MADGKILVAANGDNYLIRLTGDLRVTICTSLNLYMQSIFSNGNAKEVVVDLLQAEGIDSTTLGLLAKLAIYCEANFEVKPKLFCDSDDLIRTLDSMSLLELFDLYDGSVYYDVATEEFACDDCDMDEVKEHVLEAHKLLVALNPEKETEFRDLIKMLENG